MTFRALESLVLLEEDHNEEVLITWAYPTLEASSIITQRGRVLFTQAKTVEDATQPFLLTHRINNNWCYSCILPSSQNSSENQSGVLRYQIVLTAEVSIFSNYFKFYNILSSFSFFPLFLSFLLSFFLSFFLLVYDHYLFIFCYILLYFLILIFISSSFLGLSSCTISCPC